MKDAERFARLFVRLHLVERPQEGEPLIPLLSQLLEALLDRIEQLEATVLTAARRP